MSTSRGLSWRQHGRYYYDDQRDDHKDHNTDYNFKTPFHPVPLWLVGEVPVLSLLLHKYAETYKQCTYHNLSPTLPTALSFCCNLPCRAPTPRRIHVCRDRSLRFQPFLLLGS